MTRDSKISIITDTSCKMSILKGEADKMTAIKMGLTIEEAAECTGIGRKYNA